MLKLLTLSAIQCLFLTLSQVFLKMTFASTGKFSFTWRFFGALFTEWRFAMSGVMIVAATGLWFYIIRHFPFSVAYPMTSLSYVFGVLAAIFIFNESIPATRWMGFALLLAGIILIAKQ